MWKDFDSVAVRQIPQEENTQADELSKLDPFNPRGMAGVLVEYLESPSVDTKPILGHRTLQLEESDHLLPTKRIPHIQRESWPN